MPFAIKEVLSIDGVGAFDNIYRSTMLDKLRKVPRACNILPFVLMSYAQISSYDWQEEDGTWDTIQQTEGGKQGDPLMPLLFSLGIADTLSQIQEQLRRDEYVFAYLDDVYVIAPPERIVQIYDILKREFLEKTGIALHEGKTRVWNKAGLRPDGIQNLG